jgi:hypothetical protein
MGEAQIRNLLQFFRFKYRDRGNALNAQSYRETNLTTQKAGLQRLGIIERSPTPIPLEDRDPATLTAEEMKELIKQLKAREKESQVRVKTEGEVKIKKEKQNANLRQLATLKHEGGKWRQ